MGPGILESFREVAAVQFAQECGEGPLNGEAERVFSYRFYYARQIESTFDHVAPLVISINQVREAVGYCPDVLRMSSTVCTSESASFHADWEADSFPYEVRQAFEVESCAHLDQAHDSFVDVFGEVVSEVRSDVSSPVVGLELEAGQSEEEEHLLCGDVWVRPFCRVQ